MTEPTATLEQRPLAVLGWAAFLACSWTWCIGMFLPVILLRDYGVFAWVAFALPNVVGAAAMGWVLYRPGASEQLVKSHAPAMTAFSVVTVLFHVLFFGWVVRWLGGWAFVAVGAGVAIAAFPVLMARKPALLLSAIVWLVSLGAFVTAVANTDIASAPFGSASLELAYLTPAFVLGFALCPYLDLTFHRARQALSPFGSVAGFTLGFGVFFLAMIVFTLWYGPMAIPPDALRVTWSSPRGLEPVAAIAVVLHMAGQGGFTVAAHAVEVSRKLQRRSPGVRRGTLAGLVFGAPILIAAFVLASRGGVAGGPEFYYRDLSATEIGYRLFMSFYGLIAPAYVWIFILPYRKATPNPRQLWSTFVITIALAGPAFWMGFIERQMVWVPAGVAAIVLSRFVLSALVRRR
ncbi:hypothetical protein [Humisphaera borealis]|uniref:Uncharacterized protein n=1 Tax=Humisphaera borealis TaxID=2807512 RepID=A0A7M2WZD8_9BACT|nr:hypothetical protein [Humisphaera borealis]QOV89850.1 hypothetical protein IPV69_00300 [Humisphaera borealis]